MSPTPVRSGKIRDQTPDVHALEQSDGAIVPEKRPNKGPEARCVDVREEAVEERGPTEGNSEQPCTYRTQGRRE